MNIIFLNQYNILESINLSWSWMSIVCSLKTNKRNSLKLNTNALVEHKYIHFLNFATILSLLFLLVLSQDVFFYFIYFFFKVEKKTQKNNKLQTGLVYQVARIHSYLDTKNVTLIIYFYPFHGFCNPRYIHARDLMITSEKRKKTKNKTKQKEKNKNKSKIRNETEKNKITIIQISLSKKICSNG